MNDPDRPVEEALDICKFFELVMAKTAAGRAIDNDTLGLLACVVVNAILEVDSDLFMLLEKRMKAYAQANLDNDGYLPWGFNDPATLQRFLPRCAS